MVCRRAILVTISALIVTLALVQRCSASNTYESLPLELRPADKELDKLLKEAWSAEKSAHPADALSIAQKALEICKTKHLTSDCGILEASVATGYFFLGNLRRAEELFKEALNDAQSVGNEVLQADVLASLATRPRIDSKPADALVLVSQALNHARTSKNLYIQSRVLGEYSTLKMQVLDLQSAKDAIREALDIDQRNHYDFRPLHLVYEAQVWMAESPDNVSRAIPQFKTAYDSAVADDSFLVAVIAAEELAKAYIQTKQPEAAIDLLTKTSRGVVVKSDGTTVTVPDFEAAAQLPLYRSILLGVLADCYRIQNRQREALKTWTELYEFARASGFKEVEAGAAYEMARSSQAIGDLNQASLYYETAASCWRLLGHKAQLQQTLADFADLLRQQKDYSGSIPILKELASLSQENKNPILHLVVLTGIAQALVGEQKLHDAEQEFFEAEQALLDLYQQTNLDPKAISARALNFYIAFEDFERINKKPFQQLVLLERAMFVADPATPEMKKAIFSDATALISALNVRSQADQAFQKADLSNALLLYQVINTFESIDTKWNGHSEQGSSNALNKLFDIPFKLASTEVGAKALADNLSWTGQIAGVSRRVGYDALMRYYLRQNNAQEALRFGRLALNYVPIDAVKPIAPDVQVICLCAWSSFLAHDAQGAEERAAKCEAQARKLDPPDQQLIDGAVRLKSAVLAVSNPAEAEKGIQDLLKQAPDDLTQRFQLADVLARQGKPSEAVKVWEQLLPVYQQKKDTREEARTRWRIAQTLLATDYTKNGQRIDSELERSLQLFSSLSDVPGMIDTELALADFFAKQTDKKKSLAHLEAAMRFADKSQDQRLQAVVISKKATAAASLGNQSEALQLHERAASLYEKVSEPASQSFELTFAAASLKELGRLPEAIDLYLKSVHLSDKTSSWPAQFWARNGLAQAYEADSEYDTAIRLYKEEKQTAERAGEQLNLGIASRNLAWALIAVGEWQQAAIEAENARKISASSGEADGEFASVSLLMNIYGDRRSPIRDFEKALKYYETATRIAAENRSIDLRDLDDVLAEVYWQMGRNADAAKNAQGAANYYAQQKDTNGEAHSLMSLCEAHTRMGDFGSAEDDLKAAKRVARPLRDLYTVGRLAYTEAGLRRAQGSLPDAMHLYKQAIEALNGLKSRIRNSQEARRLADSYGFVYDDLVETLYSLAMSKTSGAQRESFGSEALQFSEENKARQFLSSWGNVFIRELRRTVPAKLQQEEQSISARLEELEAQLDGEAERFGKTERQLRDELAIAQNEWASLGKEIWSSNPAYASVRFPKPTSLSEIPLRDGETLVAFKVTDGGTFVWTVQKTRNGSHLQTFYRVPHGRDWLRNRVARLREAFNEAAPDRVDPKISEELFAALFPAEHAKEIESSAKLIVVPDDALFLVPLEMLSPSASTGEYILAGEPVVYFPSVSAVELSRTSGIARQWKQPLFAIADPLTEDTNASGSSDRSAIAATQNERGSALRARGLLLEPLPGTRTEVESIAKLFPDPKQLTLYFGDSATKDAVFRTDLSQFRFLHFATHGLLPTESNLVEPALVLSRDPHKPDAMFLQLSEVLQLRLTAESVVLSACNTGSGDISKAEGVANLGRAFLLAGASSTTVSLWQVADDSTALLMQQYYRGILNGQAKSLALADARKAVMSAGFKSPFFWAPFVLMGD